MANDPSKDPERPEAPAGAGHLSHAEFRAQVKSTRAEIERGMQATKAQLDATNERIQARTGRNLILAVLIGLAFGAVLLISLIFVKEIFIVVAAACAAFAAFELTHALRGAGYVLPRTPTVIAAVAIIAAAYYGQETGQLIALGAGLVLCWGWRLGMALAPAYRRHWRTLIRDLGAIALVQLYAALLASFSMLLLEKDGGQWWTLAFIVLVVAADTGAYASGLLFGKHPMAPSISPKKTWEGFAGAAVTSVIAGILLAVFMVHQPLWFGIIFGVVILLTATLGDLAESLIKRDIGVKDMSSWLPGHGGFLDRLDSILPSAVAAYALFRIFG
ncbi:MAG TPA: phosphatidate cytidylyltransferase [Microbacteriaceae bacterium]